MLEILNDRFLMNCQVAIKTNILFLAEPLLGWHQAAKMFPRYPSPWLRGPRNAGNMGDLVASQPGLPVANPLQGEAFTSCHNLPTIT